MKLTWFSALPLLAVGLRVMTSKEAKKPKTGDEYASEIADVWHNPLYQSNFVSLSLQSGHREFSKTLKKKEFEDLLVSMGQSKDQKDWNLMLGGELSKENPMAQIVDTKTKKFNDAVDVFWDALPDNPTVEQLHKLFIDKKFLTKLLKKSGISEDAQDGVSDHVIDFWTGRNWLLVNQFFSLQKNMDKDELHDFVGFLATNFEYDKKWQWFHKHLGVETNDDGHVKMNQGKLDDVVDALWKGRPMSYADVTGMLGSENTLKKVLSLAHS